LTADVAGQTISKAIVKRCSGPALAPPAWRSKSLVLSPETARRSRRCRETTAGLDLERNFRKARLGGENDSYLALLTSLLLVHVVHVVQLHVSDGPLSTVQISDQQS